ncbi:cupin domain-containing protein [Bacillus infantis]|uniref:cupin domain-containing protein n=1 Tax=Bacillus infantis TaxID=324767 RepID=UPI003CE6E0A4
MLHILELNRDEKKYDGIVTKICESKDKNTRILYFNLSKHDEEIPPHIHPQGEDSAYVLQGSLSYYIDLDECITVKAGELVTGWSNVIHGYKNLSENNVRFLVFATPEENLTVYPSIDSSQIVRIPIQERHFICLDNKVNIASNFTTYNTIEISGKYYEEKEDVFKVFLDLANNVLYTFEDEAVVTESLTPKRFLRFSERKI